MDSVYIVWNALKCIALYIGYSVYGNVAAVDQDRRVNRF